MDAEFCQRALRLNPDLWLAAQIAARVKERAKYPIKSIDELVAAVAGRGKSICRLEGTVLTKKHAKEYFPKIFFPIEDEDDLLRKLYTALTWGRRVHHSEQQIAAHKASV